MKDLVSVIVPIYNCERFLEECVESILKQKYSNLEIILVNDGSTDDSLKICLKYKKNNKNIIVINQKNKGLSEARNAGIRKATGKYIVFVDADDSINEQEIYKCINSIKKEKSQLVLFSYDEVYHLKNRINRYYKRIVKEYPQQRNLWQYGYAWNKLYLAEIIKSNKIFFKKDVIFVEDIIFNSEYLMYVDKISFIEESLYNYNKYDDYKTLSNSQHEKYLDMIELSIQFKLKLRDKYYKDKEEDEKYLYLYLVRQYVPYCVREKNKLSVKIKNIRKCLFKYKNKFNKYNGERLWEKIYLILIKFDLVLLLYIFTYVYYNLDLLRKKFF